MELKRVDVKDGKFCLDGKVVDVAVIELSIVTCPVHWSSELVYDGVRMRKPKKADAYYIRDQPMVSNPEGNSKNHFPVLYLHIKR